jgi:Ser/Thr protein kinase RdoA (MazF antagonist)
MELSAGRHPGGRRAIRIIVRRVSLLSGEVVEHLESAYDISVKGLAELDRDVFRVDRGGGPPWVVRVFPPERPVEAVEGDAAVLRNLAAAGFPAERCAAPVSTLGDRGVLVTQFVEGTSPDRPGRTFAILGALLGRLNARPATSARPGGAWHHLAPVGVPADEVDAAMTLLQSVRARTTGADSEHCDQLLDAVAGLDDAADLPHGFVHPDFVPANAIQVAGGGLVIVDWAGAGRGPRLWSLAYLLWAGGVRDLRLVDAAVSHYREHVQPTPDELQRLAGVLHARALLLGCWSVAAGRRTPAEAAAGLRWARRKAEPIANRAIAGFTS